MLLQGQNQMKMWQYDTFKEAEKARSWRSKKRVRDLWKRKDRTTPSWKHPKYNYGKMTTIRHKGKR